MTFRTNGGNSIASIDSPFDVSRNKNPSPLMFMALSNVADVSRTGSNVVATRGRRSTREGFIDVSIDSSSSTSTRKTGNSCASKERKRGLWLSLGDKPTCSVTYGVDNYGDDKEKNKTNNDDSDKKNYVTEQQQQQQQQRRSTVDSTETLSSIISNITMGDSDCEDISYLKREKT